MVRHWSQHRLRLLTRPLLSDGMGRACALTALTLAQPVIFVCWSFVKVNKALYWILQTIKGYLIKIKTFQTGGNYKHFELLSANGAARPSASNQLASTGGISQ